MVTGSYSAWVVTTPGKVAERVTRQGNGRVNAWQGNHLLVYNHGIMAFRDQPG